MTLLVTAKPPLVGHIDQGISDLRDVTTRNRVNIDKTPSGLKISGAIDKLSVYQEKLAQKNLPPADIREYVRGRAEDLKLINNLAKHDMTLPTDFREKLKLAKQQAKAALGETVLGKPVEPKVKRPNEGVVLTPYTKHDMESKEPTDVIRKTVDFIADSRKRDNVLDETFWSVGGKAGQLAEHPKIEDAPTLQKMLVNNLKQKDGKQFLATHHGNAVGIVRTHNAWPFSGDKEGPGKELEVIPAFPYRNDPVLLSASLKMLAKHFENDSSSVYGLVEPDEIFEKSRLREMGFKPSGITKLGNGPGAEPVNSYTVFKLDKEHWNELNTPPAA